MYLSLHCHHQVQRWGRGRLCTYRYTVTTSMANVKNKDVLAMIAKVQLSGCDGLYTVSKVSRLVTCKDWEAVSFSVLFSWISCPLWVSTSRSLVCSAWSCSSAPRRASCTRWSAWRSASSKDSCSFSFFSLKDLSLISIFSHFTSLNWRRLRTC